MEVGCLVSELLTLGFTRLPEAIPEERLAALRKALDEEPSCDPRYGVAPELCSVLGEVIPYYSAPPLVALLRGVFQCDPRLMRTSGRVATARESSIDWHSHNGSKIPRPLDDRLLWQGMPARLVCVWYVDGCDEQSGTLLVMPTSIEQPLNDPTGAVEKLECQPGTAVVMRWDIFHAVKGTDSDAERRIFAAEYQPWGYPYRLSYDQQIAGPVVEEAIRHIPNFGSLVERTGGRSIDDLPVL